MESCKEVFEAIQNEDRDPSFKWLKMKVAIEGIAREREKQMKKEQNKKLEVLQGFYGSIIDDMCKGIDCAQEFDQVVSKMNHFYEERSKRKIEKMRKLEIDDQVYDIHKLQSQRKYEGQKKINEIKLGDNVFTGTREISNAIENKMKLELEAHNDMGLDIKIGETNCHALSNN